MASILNTGETVFTATVSLMLGISVLCNVLVLVVMLKTPKMINPTNIFICNLTVSDILLAGVVIPQNIHDISHADVNYYEGDILCRIVHFCPLLCIMASIYSMVAISFERKRAIVVSAEHRTSMKQAIITIPVIWVLAFLFCVPTIYEYSEYKETLENTSTITRCGSNGVTHTFSVLNGFFIFLLAYVVPLLLLLVNYGSILWFFRSRGMFGPQTGSRSTTGQALYKGRINLVKMLILVATLFAIAWIPYFTLFLLEKISGQSDVSDSNGAFSMLRIVLAVFSTAYNFMLYVVYNRNFRNGFKALLSYFKCFRSLKPLNAVQPTGTSRMPYDDQPSAFFTLQGREPNATVT